jgi:hypothetical protein
VWAKDVANKLPLSVASLSDSELSNSAQVGNA